MSELAVPSGTVDFVMAYEDGSLTDREIVAGFQRLIDSRLAWELQGCYGRTAMILIREGLCHATEE